MYISTFETQVTGPSPSQLRGALDWRPRPAGWAAGSSRSYSRFDSEATIGPISNTIAVLNPLLERAPSPPIVDLVPARTAAPTL